MLKEVLLARRILHLAGVVRWSPCNPALSFASKMQFSKYALRRAYPDENSCLLDLRTHDDRWPTSHTQTRRMLTTTTKSPKASTLLIENRKRSVAARRSALSHLERSTVAMRTLLAHAARVGRRDGSVVEQKPGWEASPALACPCPSPPPLHPCPPFVSL